MNVLFLSQPSSFPHPHGYSRQSPQRSISPLTTMSSRKRKADDDGDESMSPMNSPAVTARQLARPAKKLRSNELIGRPLTLPRLLETLDTAQLRTVLERICERHPDIGHEVTTSAPRPSVSSVMDVMQGYKQKLGAAAPYGDSSPEYTYYRVKDSIIALVDALLDFTPQFLPPNETQPTKSLEFLDHATRLIHELPDWEPQAYRHHKENAYEEISKAWSLVIDEAGKRGGGFNLHSGGWDTTLTRHNEQSGGRLESAVSAVSKGVAWMGSGQASSNTPERDSILNQIMSGQYGPAVRVGPW